ncbi:Flp family type IVb pilin [Novosphingobium sp. MMS21-SN21R]|uniref:Flp family type IVb pilin n=1 Tax=Novosphingobium sp. MMS21-SN21R TaxID=2969298 RepID=UPI00288595A9|nr:Flp family type IVb pilin [Novosphingobium sp. MMS21-SN21R]MDT0508111.1 Flp family type IVb pilin [Novosphingobium sp. MMS21-SN21R]
MTMKILLRKIFRNESGATAIEYGLLIACIGMAMIFGMKSFSDSMYNMYLTVNNNTSEKVGSN